MDINLEKLELIEMLMNTDKISVLKKIRAIFQKEETTFLSEEQIKIVAERRTEYLSGEGVYFSYDEVKKRIEQKIS
ncbi:hypothetical protein [Chryseobacterium koreense]|uniref:Addiction module protein n=1 Tax=Chryseobacterium koreense CCUG 49689 TaxID=1304281 RepID=A0A0J7IZJ5_9FLAO|nr:hypothetical protein [Chryseobacterium koreense]KMQ71613.1 hypothetical protein ACM44_05125 [Chryseobacterium koreense CCUG 49689]MBB5333269.1 hypothetical protein [Chryseobacterium koreense]